MKFLATAIAILTISSMQHLSATKMVCIKSPVPKEFIAQLRCLAQYSTETSDGYHCLIKFDVDGKNIQLVIDKNEPRIEYGTTALATYEKKTKQGNFPQALIFANIGTGKGQIDVATLASSSHSVEDLKKATGIKKAKLYKESTLQNFEKVKKQLGKSFSDCAMPKVK
jgi:hypothetical protein